MSEPKLRGIHPKELGDFSLDQEENLYWHGEKVITSTDLAKAIADLQSNAGKLPKAPPKKLES